MYFPASCDCYYKPGGCRISEASPKGCKCKCRYLGFWTCDGYPVECYFFSDPGCHGCIQKECCEGDCGGYRYDPDEE